MFGETLARVENGEGLAFGAPIIVCGVSHETHVRDALREAGREDATIIFEPVARNTAPALAAAALVLCERDPDALMLVLPADHVIAHPHVLHKACIAASTTAQAGKIVLFAIVPDHPATGYGYIKRDAPITDGVFKVAAFVEKPDLETAQGYVASGDFAWNAGIFFFNASALIDELQQHAPDILSAAREAVTHAKRDRTTLLLDPAAFANAPAKSIDYAVLEVTNNGAVVPVDMGWSDVGSFETLWDIGAKDASQNVVTGNAVVIDSDNCLVRAGTVPVALIGVSDLIVIVTDTGIVITPKNRSQDIRLAAEAFK